MSEEPIYCVTNGDRITGAHPMTPTPQEKIAEVVENYCEDRYIIMERGSEDDPGFTPVHPLKFLKEVLNEINKNTHHRSLHSHANHSQKGQNK